VEAIVPRVGLWPADREGYGGSEPGTYNLRQRQPHVRRGGRVRQKVAITHSEYIYSEKGWSLNQ